MLGLLIHQTTPGEHGLPPAEMLMGRKLRNNLPELIKNSNINVSLKEKDRQTDRRTNNKTKILFQSTQGTGELKLLKSGNPVPIQDSIKKRWSETSIIKSEATLCSFTVSTISNKLL